MKVIEPGHIYELNQLDADAHTPPQYLVFVNREKGSKHPGTQTQEVLRVNIDMLDALIDRTNHCDKCLRWEGNDRIIKALSEAQRQLRLALLYHEQRAMERKTEKDGWKPEKAKTGKDGHRVLGDGPQKDCPLCEERVEGQHRIVGSKGAELHEGHWEGAFWVVTCPDNTLKL